MPVKRQKTQHDFNVLPEDETESAETPEGEEENTDGMTNVFKAATDAPTNSKFYKDAQA
jgi:hypothetical protein